MQNFRPCSDLWNQKLWGGAQEPVITHSPVTLMLLHLRASQRASEVYRNVGPSLDFAILNQWLTIK